MTQSGPHRPCIVYGSAKPQLGVCAHKIGWRAEWRGRSSSFSPSNRSWQLSLDKKRVCAFSTSVCVSDKGQWAALSSGDKRGEMKSEDWKDVVPPRELRQRGEMVYWRKEREQEKVSGTCGDFHSFSMVYWKAEDQRLPVPYIWIKHLLDEFKHKDNTQQQTHTHGSDHSRSSRDNLWDTDIPKKTSVYRNLLISELWYNLGF